jgi:type IV pilus assembly protein PilC
VIAMGQFVYSAVDPSGRTLRGVMEADDERLVLARLHEQHYRVLSIQPKRRGLSLASLKELNRSKKVRLLELVLFSRQFATMIDAGIPILKSLDALETQAKNPTLREVIGTVRQDVKGGMSLADALSKHPHVFSKLYVNMVRAAEVGGILDQILDRLAQFLEKELEIRQKIKSAMMYPVLVLIFSVVMVFALFTFVLPRFKEIFASMNVKMPPATQLLFNLSDYAVAYWYIPPALLVGAFVFLKQYGKNPKGRYRIDLVKLRLPIIGDLVLKMSISRFARTFGVLIASGVSMMRSLEIVAETAGNSVLATAIDNARNGVREGQKLSTPLGASGLFPTMVTHMIDVGEETGRLSDMLVKVSDFYEKEVDATVKGLTSMIEPMLIIFLGVIVGFIAISVMTPIFTLVSSIN